MSTTSLDKTKSTKCSSIWLTMVSIVVERKSDLGEATHRPQFNIDLLYWWFYFNHFLGWKGHLKKREPISPGPIVTLITSCDIDLPLRIFRNRVMSRIRVFESARSCRGVSIEQTNEKRRKERCNDERMLLCTFACTRYSYPPSSLTPVHFLRQCESPPPPWIPRPSIPTIGLGLG